MRAMVPIEQWWPALDVATRLVIQAGPTLSLTVDLAARIHDAGGVLDAEDFFTGEGAPGYRILPDDVAWIRAQNDG